MTDLLLVLYKPDGAQRFCTAPEVSLIHNVWTSVLDWLRGGDLHVIPYADHVEEVARKASIRTPRHPTYDVALWAQQAGTLTKHRPQAEGRDKIPLPQVCHQIFSSLGLHSTGHQRGRLNQEAIDLIYGGVIEFQRHRDELTRRLLGGPILLERWAGPRKELALALKTVVRRSLAAAPMTNLIHMDVGDDFLAAELCRCLDSAR